MHACPKAIFEALLNGASITFRSLPPLDQEPEDEKTPAFLERLASARRLDEIYLAEMDGLAVDELTSMKALDVGRRLRDMPPRRIRHATVEEPVRNWA
jgi:hypothetical protein